MKAIVFTTLIYFCTMQSSRSLCQFVAAVTWLNDASNVVHVRMPLPTLSAGFFFVCKHKGNAWFRSFFQCSCQRPICRLRGAGGVAVANHVTAPYSWLALRVFVTFGWAARFSLIIRSRAAPSLDHLTTSLIHDVPRVSCVLCCRQVDALS